MSFYKKARGAKTPANSQKIWIRQNCGPPPKGRAGFHKMKNEIARAVSQKKLNTSKSAGFFAKARPRLSFGEIIFAPEKSPGRPKGRAAGKQAREAAAASG
jgi:hypothetical protein